MRYFFFISLLWACATTHPPVTTTLDFEQGNQYAKDGLLKEAADSYLKALKISPDHPQIHKNLGIVFVKLGNYSEATQHLKFAAKQTPQPQFETYFYLAESLRAKDQHADAIFFYQKALELDQNETRALKALAWSYYKIRFYSEALKTAKRAKSVDIEDEQIPIILARIYIKIKNYQDALLILNDSSASFKELQKPFVDSVRGDVFFAMDAPDKALHYYQLALKEQPMLSGALLGIGKTLLNKGNTDTAIPFLEKSLRIKPKNLEGYLYLAQAYETKNPVKALKYYRHFAKGAKQDPEFFVALSNVQKKLTEIASKIQKKKS